MNGCSRHFVERFSSVGVSATSSVGYLVCNPLILRVSVGSVGTLKCCVKREVRCDTIWLALRVGGFAYLQG